MLSESTLLSAADPLFLPADTAKYVVSIILSCTDQRTRLKQNLAPVYEQLADAFVGAKDKVVIAKVDADGEGKPLGSKYGVTGFPSAWNFLPGLCTESHVSQRSSGSTRTGRTSRTRAAGISMRLRLCERVS